MAPPPSMRATSVPSSYQRSETWWPHSERRRGSDLRVNAFFMECDDARPGGFEPLRFVPKGKLVVLGLVSTKRGG
jgi:hypothetical protein